MWENCQFWKFREFRHSSFVPSYSDFTVDLEGNRGSERLRRSPDELECSYDHYFSFKIISNHRERFGNDTEATGARFRLEFLGFPQTHHLWPGAPVNNSVTHCNFIHLLGSHGLSSNGIIFQLVLLTVFKSNIFLETFVLLARNHGVWDVQIPRSQRPGGYHHVPRCY